MIDYDFQLEHKEEELFVLFRINGMTFRTNVTEYFSKENPYDEWVKYRQGLKGEKDKKKS